MSFLGFGARSNQPNKLGSIQVQTSEYGVPIPYAAGTLKLAVKLLDYVNFKQAGQTSSGKGGSISSYEYFASIDAGACYGPSGGIGNVYDQGGASSLSGSTETYTIPAGGGTYTSQFNSTEEDQGVTYAQPYTFTANDFGSDGERILSGIQQAPMQKVAANPGGLQYTAIQDSNVTSSSQGVITASGGNLHYTFSAADAGKTVAITYSYTTNTTNYVSPAAKYALAFLPGGPAGSVWGYMASNYPDRALSYPNVTRIVAQNYDLGSDASLPNLSVEVLNARGLAFGSGIADCDPADIIRDMCGPAPVGFSWPYLGDLTGWSNFCVANNLFQSVGIDSQRKALDVLTDMIMLSNSEAVWSGGALKVIPYGDTTAVANGRTFTPNTTPIYELDYSDIICEKGQEPILSSWKGLADNYNSIQLQYTRRDDNYNNDVINDKDEASILMNGLLPMKTIVGDNYREKEFAAVAANMLLKRNAVALRQHTFKLKWWYQLLEPMDVVLLTPLNRLPVRVVSVQENDDYSLSVVAEDFKFGVGTGVLYPKGDSNSAFPQSHAQPGNTQILAAFEPNTRVTGGQSQLWLALTGGPSWGGCSLWISKDGTSYARATDSQGNPLRQYGSSRAGSLQMPLAAGTDPDTADTITVQTTGELLSGTQADADIYATLCLLGNELISYQTATLQASAAGENTYQLGTYLRRGVFAQNAQAHNVGEIFVRLDAGVLKFPLDPSLVGQSIFIKLTSFNLLNGEEQSLADVAAQLINLNGSGAATNMAVGSYLESDGTATVIAYKQGGNPGDAGAATTAQGVLVTIPANSFTGLLSETWYGVNYRAGTGYQLYTDQGAWRADQGSQIAIGATVTPAAGSTGTAGGSSGGAIPASNFNDTGSSPTNNPAGAYTAGETAQVTSSAVAYSSGGGSRGPITD